MREIIKAENLTKDFGNHKGIFSVSISVKEGEIYGFLGPNGAGKSTTIRHLLGFLRPQEGSCQILGMDCFRDAGKIQQHLGYLPGEIAFMEDMTGRQLLDFLTEMKGIKDITKREQLMERFELDPTRKVRKMSKGMKQKIGIITAFMANPSVILLDEPTSGLDPLMQNRFVELLLEEKAQGKTILMSSHIFEEIEKTCDRTAIIRDGHIVAVEDMESLAGKKNKEYEITFQTQEECQRFCSTYKAKKTGKQIVRVTDQGDISKMLGELSQYQIKDLDIHKQSLEEIFLQYYGQKGGER